MDDETAMMVSSLENLNDLSKVSSTSEQCVTDSNVSQESPDIADKSVEQEQDVECMDEN